jgi:hypothetical protein
MLKPRTFKYLWAAIVFGLSGSAYAQPVLGQIIEQTKKNKLKEAREPKPTPFSGQSAAGLPPLPPMPPLPSGTQRNPAPVAVAPAPPVTASAAQLAPAAPAAPAAQLAPAAPIITEAKPPEPPMLWSISGVNQPLIAELWDQKAVHRVTAVPGQTLPGGWKLVQASPSSLTIKLDEDTRTLYPAALGSTGGEFTPIKRLMAEAGITAHSPSGPRDARAASMPFSLAELVSNSTMVPAGAATPTNRGMPANPAPLPPVGSSAAGAPSGSPDAAAPREAAGNLPAPKP